MKNGGVVIAPATGQGIEVVVAAPLRPRQFAMPKALPDEAQDQGVDAGVFLSGKGFQF